MSQDQARAMFESAMLRESKCNPEFLKWNGDRYDFDSMELAWAGFQLGIQAGLTPPPSYTLVPVEPTEAMLKAVKKADFDHGPYKEWLQDDGIDFITLYRAALAAAQKGGK